MGDLRRKIDMGDRGIFKLDRKFVKELRSRLSKSRFITVPSVEQTEEIISATVWASTQHEEGRLSRFGVAFGEPMPLDYLALKFEVPKPLNVEELRRLAPAVLPSDGYIGVWPHKESGALQIWGLQTTSTVQLTVEVIDPGRIGISAPLNIKVAEIAGQRAGFISSDWNRAGLELMANDAFRASGSPTEPVFNYLSTHITREMLRRVRSLGHGGAIIFVPDNNRWMKSADPVFYDCEQHLNKVQQITESFRKNLQAIDGDRGLDERGKLEKGMGLFADHNYKVFITDAAETIAQLTSVDGSTLLNHNFKVVAFGVKLRASRRAKAGTVETVTKVLPLESDPMLEEVPLDAEFRGTRHLSAARFVLNNPDSRAFVVSQDGGVTGLMMGSTATNPTLKLLAYRGLELLL
jgi:hypothetical protein